MLPLLLELLGGGTLAWPWPWLWPCEWDCELAVKLSDEYCLSRSARRGGAAGLAPAPVLAPGDATADDAEPPGEGMGECGLALADMADAGVREDVWVGDGGRSYAAR